MAKITLQTSGAINPMIYAYTTPTIPEHKGWIKIGYTELDVDQRIAQQTKTANITAKKEWQGAAIYDDGSGDRFTDKEFHRYLRKAGVENLEKTEWFKIAPTPSKHMFYDFRSDRGIFRAEDVIPYTLRDEQARCVDAAISYMGVKPNGEFLINAKPRFGKTLTVYDFCRKANAQFVLIVTNRPAIANSWYDDYVAFMGEPSGYQFVSSTDTLKGKQYVLSRDEYISGLRNGEHGCIEFVSLQDLKGSIYFGGKFDKLKHIKDMTWDVLVIDEAHEGVDTFKTDVAFDQIKRKFTIHLSGTPFKALASSKFPEEAIFNWTYADEQEAKANWDPAQEENNPYARLPRLNLFTYQMSEIVKDELRQGVEIEGETEEYAFDLNEFFSTDGRGKFVYDSSVDKFLNALTTQEKYPFSTPELRDELRHTFWLLNRVDSAKALAVKLKKHPVFQKYEIVLAAGDGKLDDDEETQKALNKVRKAIAENEYTITLSVGQLTTGITVPEWTAVLMLSNMKSPSLYMQSAFRSQNPCVFRRKNKFFRKENAYVFDFDPARTLTSYDEFANDLSPESAGGRGDTELRKRNIRRLLNFFPVIGEDDSGEMIELDAEKVLSIPRKIKSQEVVRRGFMSNYLFQNIGHIFGAPQEILDIITQFPPIPEPEAPLVLPPEDESKPHIDGNGDIQIPDGYVDVEASALLGDGIYESLDDQADSIVGSLPDVPDPRKDVKKKQDEQKKALIKGAVESVMTATKGKYQDTLKPADERRLEKKLTAQASVAVEKAFSEYDIAAKEAEAKRLKDLASAYESGRTEEEINQEYDAVHAAAKAQFEQTLHATVETFLEDASRTAIVDAETAIQSHRQESIEETVKDHLRGFARTIPSFLMAYGDESVTLETFDQIIPDDVFREVTSITLAQFRMLRDGGTYLDAETGEEKHFAGHLFEPVVFDDSVREFLRIKASLADYFTENSTEDIFDYIPPQKTNQIYTPKRIVKMMVDMLEAENPGCFDDPDKTFADLYMKSGLYIAEVVKRLFRSERMKELFPDETKRLQHIFAKQVYGLAPTEIIYRIAVSYVLGFNDDLIITEHHLRKADVVPAAKAGKMNELLDEVFGDGAPVMVVSEDDGRLAGPEEDAYDDAAPAPGPVVADAPPTVEAEDGQIKYAETEPQSPRKNVIAILREHHAKFKDKRNKGGNLWVTGGQELLPMIEECRREGYAFKYSANGSKQTKYKPGWFLPAK